MIFSDLNGISTNVGDTLSFWYSDDQPGGGLLNVYDDLGGVSGSDFPTISLNLPQTPDDNGGGGNCISPLPNPNSGADYCPFTQVVVDLKLRSVALQLILSSSAVVPPKAAGRR